MYDPRMKEHRNEMDPWHPEVPDRISRIWEALCSMGYTDRCRVIQVRDAPVMSDQLQTSEVLLLFFVCSLRFMMTSCVCIV